MDRITEKHVNESFVFTPEVITVAPTKNRPKVQSQRHVELTYWIPRFLVDCTKARNTRISYETDLRLFGNVTAGNLSDDVLTLFKEMVLETKAPRSAARCLIVVKLFMSYLVEKGVLDKNPWGHLRRLTPPIDKHDSPTIALTDSEVRTMINHPDRSTLTGASQRLAMVMGFYMGLRRSESVQVKVSDLTLSEGSPSAIRNEFDEYGKSSDTSDTALGWLTIRQAKGNKTRKIPLDEAVLDEFRNYFDLLAVLGLPLEGYVLRSRKCTDGKDPVRGWAVNDWFIKVASACGIKKHVTSHTGRATAITKALSEGAGIRDVAIFAGHTDINTTGIYDKRRGEASMKTIKKIRY